MQKNHQVLPSERLQYPHLARRWHFGFREETEMRGKIKIRIKTQRNLHIHTHASFS